MKEGKASRTAEGTAFSRAVESTRPAGERLFYDPYAKGFLSRALNAIANSRVLATLVIWNSERTNPGGISFAMVRTRYIDECLRARIDDGIQQLVVLGAGYDSRAYRFDGLKGRVKVFEVDHPATQKVKKEKVEKLFGTLPDHVVYIPINFDEEKLARKLLEGGYDRHLKTLFIWEGVTMYLTAEAVDETLAAIVDNSGEDSSVIFDYIYEGAVDGTLKGSEKWRKVAERLGEPPSFGIEDGTVGQFLKKRGFDRVNDMSVESLTNHYREESGRNLRVFPFSSIVHATVKPWE